ncbi:MAG TPA: exonuclease SbcCD subunit D [Nocardioidaceae bacterium]|nr:exonuclease SbcCD subunit D [Nocardioidaceae bacterium]
MRVLHTSDWHLGRSFHREGMLDAQSAFVDHIVDIVSSEKVDLVVVSGDIFDRALPPVDAVELASDALRRLLSAHVRVVVTSGNHDSAPRLGFASELIDAAGVHVRTDPRTVGTPVVIPDQHGDVAVYGLPYLEPDLVRDGWGLAGRSHQAALDEAMSRVRDDLGRRDPSARSIVMAHAFVTGAAASDSERDISVGGVSQVGITTFDGVDYVALGHLHGRHTLSESVRYSGSPLAYSFSEAAHRKGSWLVELDATGLSRADFVDAPIPRLLAVLEGPLDGLLTNPRHAHHEGSWVQATLTDAVRPLHALERLRQRYPHVLVVRYAPDVHPGAEPIARVAARSAVDDIDVVRQFFVDTRESGPTADELALLRDACDACRVEADAAS